MGKQIAVALGLGNSALRDRARARQSTVGSRRKQPRSSPVTAMQQLHLDQSRQERLEVPGRNGCGNRSSASSIIARWVTAGSSIATRCRRAARRPRGAATPAGDACSPREVLDRPQAQSARDATIAQRGGVAREAVLFHVLTRDDRGQEWRTSITRPRASSRPTVTTSTVLAWAMARRTSSVDRAMVPSSA